MSDLTALLPSAFQRFDIKASPAVLGNTAARTASVYVLPNIYKSKAEIFGPDEALELVINIPFPSMRFPMSHDGIPLWIRGIRKAEMDDRTARLPSVVLPIMLVGCSRLLTFGILLNVKAS